MSSKKVYKLVYLEWEDAVTNSEGWLTEGQALNWAKETHMTVKEVGWLIAETPTYLAFADSIADWSPDSQMSMNGVTKIPKTWIRKRIDLSSFIDELPESHL